MAVGLEQKRRSCRAHDNLPLPMSLPPTDPPTLALRQCNNKKIRASLLRLADAIVRQVLYPAPPDQHEHDEEQAALQVTSVLGHQRRHAARCELAFHARTLRLRALPAYVDKFVDVLLAHVDDAEVLSAVKSYVVGIYRSLWLTFSFHSQILRYAVMEHADSGLRVEPDADHPVGFAVYTTVPRYQGDVLACASAHIARDAGDRVRPRRWFDGRPSREDRKWLLGPARFALFACSPARKCCIPNCEVRSCAYAAPILTSYAIVDSTRARAPAKRCVSCRHPRHSAWWATGGALAWRVPWCAQCSDCVYLHLPHDVMETSMCPFMIV